MRERSLTRAELAAEFADRAAGLRRMAYLLCGDWTRAEDLVQTAFANVYAARRRIRARHALGAYLRQALTRTYLDANMRHWRREHPTETLPDATPIDVRDDVENRLVLLAALERVPPRQRACLVLRFYDDCSVEDAAEILGCSTGTVKSNTARGLDTLRAVLTIDAPELLAHSRRNP
jgi:RNA polymerase sigma-70 factor (sigma-E family)